MNIMQEQVEEFHKKFNHVTGSYPAIRDVDLRIRIMKEEMQETCEAIEKGDLVEAIDGMCDVMYVVLGTALAFGIDLEPFFNEVHQNNMQKIPGNKDSGGKTTKPPGHKPPDIAGILDTQRGNLDL